MFSSQSVAPRAGAWIETNLFLRGYTYRESHPVRVRGLKRRQSCGQTSGQCVAPRAGAWIETLFQPLQYQVPTVAPRAGAWIETYANINSWFPTESHPVRVRGLKHGEKELKNLQAKSHPVRVRGLKQYGGQSLPNRNQSHPVRVRGLKLML